jgi:hypothetical protein
MGLSLSCGKSRGLGKLLSCWSSCYFSLFCKYQSCLKLQIVILRNTVELGVWVRSVEVYSTPRVFLSLRVPSKKWLVGGAISQFIHKLLSIWQCSPYLIDSHCCNGVLWQTYRLRKILITGSRWCKFFILQSNLSLTFNKWLSTDCIFLTQVFSKHTY